jgi:hypothetical protein
VIRWISCVAGRRVTYLDTDTFGIRIRVRNDPASGHSSLLLRIKVFVSQQIQLTCREWELGEGKRFYLTCFYASTTTKLFQRNKYSLLYIYFVGPQGLAPT